MLDNIREEIKELWNSFTTPHKPYVQLGLLLNIVRKQKLYLGWKYRKMSEYVADIHIPYTNYVLYISVANNLTRLNLTVEEGLRIERNHTVGRVIAAAKAARGSKDVLFQRLNGTYEDIEVRRKKYQIGPFTLSLREMDKIWRAKRIMGDATRKFEKEDLIKLAKYVDWGE